MKLRSTAIVALFIATSFAAVAQEKPEDRARNVYKLEFTVYELEAGKRINERSYTLHALDGDRRGASTRVGTRVPVSSGGEKGVQYLDVGIRIDANVQAADDSSVTLSINFESSGFAVPEQGQNPQAGTPVLRNVSENVVAKVPFGKVAMISSVDDVNSKRRLQVEVAASRVR